MKNFIKKHYAAMGIVCGLAALTIVFAVANPFGLFAGLFVGILPAMIIS